MEKALLTHKGRERTQAIAVFTLIFAFAVTSVDFLLTGGPEFGEGARAATYTAHVDLIAPRSASAQTAEPTQLASNEVAAVEEEAARVTAAPAPQVREISDLAGVQEAPKAEPELSGVAPAPKDKA